VAKNLKLCDRSIGKGTPCFIVGEIGLNHNGDVDIAKRLIDVAGSAGMDAVKFQKRNPDKCVPADQKTIPRETPWGVMSYLEYRYRVEFGFEEYREIDRYCRERGIAWFASSWDTDSLAFIEQFDPPCHKISSASITDKSLLKAAAKSGRPVIMSTGMSSMQEIQEAVELLDKENMVLLHCNSSYPANEENINLEVMDTLGKTFNVPVGYSGHERGLQISVAAVARGACIVERHITLDRTMWGSDHAASLEPTGIFRLVRDIRIVEKALGDGVKRVYPEEEAIRKKLRKA